MDTRQILWREAEEIVSSSNFQKKVNKTDTCWLWTGANIRGYGQI